MREAQEKLARIKASLKEGEAQQQVRSLTLVVPATRQCRCWALWASGPT